MLAGGSQHTSQGGGYTLPLNRRSIVLVHMGDSSLRQESRTVGTLTVPPLLVTFPIRTSCYARISSVQQNHVLLTNITDRRRRDVRG